MFGDRSGTSSPTIFGLNRASLQQCGQALWSPHGFPCLPGVDGLAAWSLVLEDTESPEVSAVWSSEELEGCKSLGPKSPSACVSSAEIGVGGLSRSLVLLSISLGPSDDAYGKTHLNISTVLGVGKSTCSTISYPSESKVALSNHICQHTMNHCDMQWWVSNPS